MGVSVPVRLVDRLGHFVDQFVHWNVAVRLGRYRFVYGRLHVLVAVTEFRCVGVAVPIYGRSRNGVAGFCRLVGVPSGCVAEDVLIVELRVSIDVVIVEPQLSIEVVIVDRIIDVLAVISRIACAGVAYVFARVVRSL